MRPHRFRWNAVLLVFLGGALAMAVRAQGPSGPPPLSWPPAPADIVNLRADGFAVPAAGPARIYDVPGDRWLVLTDVVASGSATIGSPQFGIPAGLTEAAGATNTLKVETGLQTPYHSSGAVGLTFKPGSRVLIDLDAGAPATNKTISYSIQGYLATQP